MKILQTGRIKIAYEASGSGDAGVVILIRGQGSQLIHWPESFYEAFSARGFLTIRFDNRDTGLSSKFDSIAHQIKQNLLKTLGVGLDVLRQRWTKKGANPHAAVVGTQLHGGGDRI